VSFASPFGLLALLALVPLVVAYFLRRRQPPRKVSALFLWKTPLHQSDAGPKLMRFSPERAFILEALAVCCAALFLADGRCGGPQSERSLVLVVDGSLSMSARAADGQTIADRVRLAAARAVEESGVTRLSVVESGSTPRLLAGPAASVSDGLAALERWRPQGAAHDPSAAFALALELGGARRFLTDAPVKDPPPGLTVESVGEPLENVALVWAQRRDQGAQASVAVRVANFSAQKRSVAVRFSGPPADASLPGGADRSATLELEPGGAGRLQLSFANAGPIEVRLPDDALPDDGRITLSPAPEAKLNVQLMSALDAAAQSALRRFVEVAPLLRLGEPADWVIGAPGTAAQLRVGTTGEPQTFLGPFFLERGHPLLEDVALDGVLWTAGANPPGRPIVTAGSWVLIAEGDDGSVTFNLDLARSTLAHTPAWPVLLGNAARRARDARPGFSRHQLLLGEEIPVTTGAGATWMLEGPGGRRPLLGVGPVRLQPPTEPGELRLLRDGQPVDRLSVLPLDPLESDLRTRAPLPPSPLDARPALASTLTDRSPAPLLALLVLLSLDFLLLSLGRSLS
jgi:hypothetical protein